MRLIQYLRRALSVGLCVGLCTGCAQDASGFPADAPERGQAFPRPLVPHSAASSSYPLHALSLPEDPPEALPVQDTVVMNFVGDVMLAAENGDDGFWSFNLFAYETPQEYFFEKMYPMFSSDDYTVVNCENVFTDDPDPTKREKEGDEAYWYYSGTQNAQILAKGSVEIASLANNHALDYGYEGRDDTVEALRAAGVAPITERKALFLEKAGIRIGLFCASLYSDYYLPPILEWLEENADSCDFCIVYYHGGKERVHTPEEWRVSASRAMVDAGADLVLGSHPHVLQPTEEYKGARIIYSLGNLVVHIIFRHVRYN